MFKKLKKNYFLLISTFLFLYFFFNLLDGERGLISYFQKKNLLNELKNKEILLNDKSCVNYGWGFHLQTNVEAASRVAEILVPIHSLLAKTNKRT